MHRLLWSAFAATPLIVVSMVSGPVTAQETEAQAVEVESEVAPEEIDALSEGARTLFREGLQFAGVGDFTQAAARFRAALELREAPAIQHNLASALFELERHAEAMQLVQKVLTNPESPESVRAPAAVLRDRLAEHLGVLTVQVDSRASDLTVVLDGRELEPGELGTAIWVMPGTHLVIAARGQLEVDRAAVEVAVGSRELAQLSELPAAVIEEDPRPPDRGGVLSDWRLWAGIGAVIVVATVVVLVAVVTNVPEDPMQGDFTPGVIVWD